MSEDREIIKQIIKQSGCENVTACPELTKRSEACLLDNTGGVRDFENSLMTEHLPAHSPS